MTISILNVLFQHTLFMNKFSSLTVPLTKFFKSGAVNGMCFCPGVYQSVFDPVRLQFIMQSLSSRLQLFNRMLYIRSFQLNEISVPFIFIHQKEVAPHGSLPNYIAINLILGNPASIQI